MDHRTPREANPKPTLSSQAFAMAAVQVNINIGSSIRRPFADVPTNLGHPISASLPGGYIEEVKESELKEVFNDFAMSVQDHGLQVDAVVSALEAVGIPSAYELQYANDEVLIRAGVPVGFVDGIRRSARRISLLSDGGAVSCPR